ncbi:hypothetical protein BD289DRAFT_202401 [Coniella lustricola]|uniref:Uncharacterized protein n=1 Tax=Coniella lustricola TaxID=2025994 RepID=A0A2T3ACM6_9PEZI|nr:hypothetical protein BD289DRAFT_202401 [Coniella lustricola]
MTDTSNRVVPVGGNGSDFLPLNDSDNNTQGTPMTSNNSDSSTSDVSMAAETDDDDAVRADAAAVSHPLGGGLHSAEAATTQKAGEHNNDSSENKRKFSGDMPDNDDAQSAIDSSKKIRLGNPDAKDGSCRTREWLNLPSELWHHIFAFCPPRTLGNLLRVTRLFNVYLDPLSTLQCRRPPLLSDSPLSVLNPNAIWQISRRRFWPGMPNPFQDKTELQMWQLCLCTTCQSCGKKPDVSRDNDLGSWQSGPGHDGVAVIWPFATRSCGVCLLSKSIKEIDILLSSSIPTALMAALPFVFVTQDLQALSPVTVEKGQLPDAGELTKLYWLSHVEELKTELFNVKAMGSATAEEWLKGLDGRGIERRNDATKWENWAMANGGLSMVESTLYPGYQPSTPSPDGTTIDTIQTGPRIPGLAHTDCSSEVSHLGRNDRTKEQVAALKAARKAEIERRVLALEPPLPLKVLPYIPSFQAALQIITPLDDQGWEVLKPRLLAQSADAEKREKEAPTEAKKEADETNTSDAAPEAREVGDADWDEIQAPVRARVAGYADEIIRDGWDNGDKVNRDNCSKFAVEVLTYIRKRFYAEVFKDAAAARAAGRSPISDPPDGPYTQKLTLENMKWIFEAKVKPHTERFRKEIFLCNGCEATVRYYGFEGIIQHFAAKHTKVLSLGNMVVYWRAEWPGYPPFTWESKNMKLPPLDHGSFQPPDQALPFLKLASVPTSVYEPPSWGEAGPQASQAPYSVLPNHYVPAQEYQAVHYPHPDAPHTYPTPQAQPQSFNQPIQSQPFIPPSYPSGAHQTENPSGYYGVPTNPFSHEFQTQLEEMARIARELWNATSNMRGTLATVRVQVVVYHMAKRFHAKFGIPLPLTTFIEGLSNHKDMRPVRNVNELTCRVCRLGIGGYVASMEERKSWSLPQLTSHFQYKHVEPFLRTSPYAQPPEWTVEMVMLPEPAEVPNLHAAIRMDGLKYHLVNEAVPHLLSVSIVPDAAALMAQPAWQEQTDHHQYELPVSYYNQADYNNHAEIPNAEPHHYASEMAASLNDKSGPAYRHAEPVITNANTVLPIEDPAAAASSAALIRQSPKSRNDDGVRFRASQGGRSSRDQQSARQSKKSKKKSGGNNRHNPDEEARKRIEEEEKMAEEEAEREADVIRAMWAADRVNAVAGNSVLPDGGGSVAREMSEAGSSRLGLASTRRSSKANTPKQWQRLQSRQPRDSPRRNDRNSYSVPQETSQVPPPARGESPLHRGHQLSNVTYVDNQPHDTPATRNVRIAPSAVHDHHDSDFPPRELQSRRSASPVYQTQNQPHPPAGQYRQRSPSPRPRDQSIHYRPRDLQYADDDAYYQRQAQESPYHQDEYHAAHDENFANPPQGYGDLIEIEIIEYRRPDGTVWIEERPLRRIPGPERGRYLYHDDDSYAPPPPQQPLMASSAYSRHEMFNAPLESEPEPHYHRQPQPPALPPAANEPILLSSSSSSAAGHYYDEPLHGRQLAVGRDDYDYHRFHAPAHQQRIAAERQYNPYAQPRPPRAPTVVEQSDYDSRYASNAPPLQQQSRPLRASGTQEHYGEEQQDEEDEEYDPRFPAGPPRSRPPPRHMSTLPPRPPPSSRQSRRPGVGYR